MWLKPPLSLVFLEAYLRSQKIKINLLDLNRLTQQRLNYRPKDWLKLNQEWEDGLFLNLEKENPQILEYVLTQIKESHFIGFSLFKRNYLFCLSLAEKIKKVYPEKKIILGGPQALFLDKKLGLNQNFHWVIGEGEKPLAKIISGSKEKTYRFCQINDLDCLPFYSFDSLGYKKIDSLPLFSSRGCKFKCKFCTERLLYKKFRQHCPAYIIGQIKYLISRHQTKYFIFNDSFLNYNLTWLEKFAKMAIKEKLNIKWEAQFRVDTRLPLTLARLLKASGCYNLFIGMESASDKVLGLMNKGFTCSQAITFFKILKQAGIHFEISLIFDYPGETKTDFEKTITFIRKNKNLIPKIAQANPFIDYWKKEEAELKSQKDNNKMSIFLETIEREKIPYTKSFINNLLSTK